MVTRSHRSNNSIAVTSGEVRCTLSVFEVGLLFLDENGQKVGSEGGQKKICGFVGQPLVGILISAK